jgi:hypothetical protein
VPDEQLTKGIVLHAMRLAVLDVFGEDGLADVATRVSSDTRVQTVEASASPLAWVPERFLVEWHEAVLEGPAKRDDAALCRVINRRIDFGFGRVRKALLGLVGPEGVAKRATELWKHDHTHGVFALVIAKDSQSAAGTLSDHVFCASPIARRALAETFRYIVQLSRGVKVARETHGLQGDSLTIRVTWE